MPSNVIGPIDSGADVLNDLTNVNTNPVANDVLCFDGTNWVNVPKANQAQALNDHTDVTTTNVQNLDTLCYDSATGQWINTPKVLQNHVLDFHDDVVFTSAQPGDVLCFDGVLWVNVPKSNQSLTEHSDVTLTTPANNDTLCFDSASGQWVNVPKATGIPAHSIDNHTDVTLSAPVDGQTLCYDAASGQWVNVDKYDGSCCLPDPTGLSVLDPVYIDPTTGAVTLSDLSNPDTVAQYVVVGFKPGQVCIQDFGIQTLDAPHGVAVGECVYETASGGSSTTPPASGINNVLYHAIDANKISVTAGTRPFDQG